MGTSEQAQPGSAAGPDVAAVGRVLVVGAGAMGSQIGMVGPVSTILMSLLILGEPMGAWQVVGTVMVMLGVFVVTRPAR